MSGFIGAAVPGANIFADDRRAVAAWFQREQDEPNHPDRGYRSPFWPRTGFHGNPVTDGFIAEAVWHSEPDLVSGSVSRFGYRGVTRDAQNSPLAGVTVKIFRTVDDSKQADDVVSDSDGNFTISTPYYEPHYLVMRKAGSPEVSGVTVSSQYPNT